MINNSLFQSIKGALAQEKSNAGISEILKTEVGNTYSVRLLPDIKNPKNTFFHYFTHGWTSFATGEYVAALSPQTFGERDPIAEERFRILRTGTEADKEKVKAIGRSEKWLINVLVVNDPVNSENNGKVKILRYGKQLQKIISDAIEGEDADELGARVFDLGPNGVNLKIKVEKQGDYPSYVSSKFTMPAALPDMDDAKAKKIYESVHDLVKVFQLKSYDELKTMLQEHYFLTTVKDVKETEAPEASTATEQKKTSTVVKDTAADDDIKSILESLDVD
jgi:hypothetical protein